MRKKKRISDRLKVAVVGVAGTAILATGGNYLFGAGIATMIVVVALLWLVWRLDNATGTFLPLAVLLLIVLATLAFLMGALAFVHRLTTG